MLRRGMLTVVVVMVAVFGAMGVGRRRSPQLLAYLSAPSGHGQLHLHLHDLRQGIAVAPRPLNMVVTNENHLLWSPGTGRMYLNRDGIVHHLDLATGAVAVTKLADWDVVRDVSWSPDGAQVAVSPAAGGLYVGDSNSTTFANPISDANNTLLGRLSLDWSPDGRKLAVMADTGPDARLYLMQGPGWQARIVNLPYSDMSAPSWSPDGTRLTFAARRTSEHPSQLYAIEAEAGASPMMLTHTTLSEMNPTWSPDGRYILYQGRDGGQNEVYVMAVADRIPRNLTQHPASDRHPQWAGRQVVFVSNRTGNLNLFTMNPNTAVPRNISQLSKEHVVSVLVWSP